MNLRGRPVGRRATTVAALVAPIGIGFIVHEIFPAGMPGFLLFAAIFVPFVSILHVFFSA